MGLPDRVALTIASAELVKFVTGFQFQTSLG